MRVFLVGGALAMALGASPAHASKELASPSDDFVEAAGINTHFDVASTMYVTHFSEVKAAIVAGGFRHLRGVSLGTFQTGADGGVTFVPLQLMEEMAAAGVRIDFFADLNSGTAGNAVELAKAFLRLHPGSISSVEGPNEPDGFWTVGYKGQPFPAGAVLFQRELYAAMKGAPETAAIPVYGIALGGGGVLPCTRSNPLGNQGELEASVDFGNFHPYPFGNPFHPDFNYDFQQDYYHNVQLPSATLDPTPAPGLTGRDDAICFASKSYGKAPLVATETGIALTAGGTPERHLAPLLPRILLENFRLGVKRTLLYELIDTAGNDPAYGMIRSDLTPRPSYPAVQALLTRLADPGPAFTPGSLDFTLNLSPVTVTTDAGTQTFDKLSYIHHLLFQRRDGTFQLVLWHEIATDGWNGAHVDLQPPPMPATLQLSDAFARIRLTTVDEGGIATQTELTPAASIPLQITERFSILELQPAAADVPVVPGPLPGDGGAVIRPRALAVRGGCSAGTLDGAWLLALAVVLASASPLRRRHSLDPQRLRGDARNAHRRGGRTPRQGLCPSR